MGNHDSALGEWYIAPALADVRIPLLINEHVPLERGGEHRLSFLVDRPLHCGVRELGGIEVLAGYDPDARHLRYHRCVRGSRIGGRLGGRGLLGLRLNQCRRRPFERAFATALHAHVVRCLALVGRRHTLRRFHRGMEGREIDDTQHLVARQPCQLQREAAREGERAFGADQQVCEVDAAVAGVGPLALRMEDVEVVAGHAAHHLRPVRLDLAALGVGQAPHEVGDRALLRAEGGHRPEAQQAAVGEPRRDAQHVVHHVAVGDAAAAARVVARHAAQRGLRAGRHVHGIPELVFLQLGVQLVEHHAWLDQRGARFGTKFGRHRGTRRFVPALAGAFVRYSPRRSGHFGSGGNRHAPRRSAFRLGELVLGNLKVE